MALPAGCSAVALWLLLVAALATPAKSGNFLKHDPKPLGLRAADLDADFMRAMESVAECGARASGVGRDHAREVEAALAIMWPMLPKNDHGFVEWRMLRYLAHRYFLQRSHLLAPTQSFQ